MLPIVSGAKSSGARKTGHHDRNTKIMPANSGNDTSCIDSCFFGPGSARQASPFTMLLAEVGTTESG
jgi:hypothetical protein